MKYALTILIFAASLSCYSQNWNVFNREYRYNYRHDTADIITNVLFQDTIKQRGTDTIYALNRVASVCSAACPGFSVAFTPTNPALITNMPQFLQRYVVKYSNGLVMLSDPFKLVIKPNCVLNQIWLFDSLANYQATCTAIGLQTIFGVNDSVKTMVINSTDTVQLSKTFGLIKFSDLYGKNKSYRLVGIEKRHSYDSVALYGTKVPNAWDFYNYQVGDEFCESYTGIFTSSFKAECRNVQYRIVSKGIGPNNYAYEAHIISATSYKNPWSQSYINCNYEPFIYTTKLFGYENLNSETLLENIMYPGMVVVNRPIPGTESQFSGIYASRGYPNVAFLKKNSNGRLFKAMGLGGNGLIPSGNYSSLGCASSPLIVCAVYSLPLSNLSSRAIRFIIGEGWGVIGAYVKLPEFTASYARTCFIHNGSVELGGPYVGTNEIESESAAYSVFPNPASGTCFIRLPENAYGNTQTLVLKNLLGETVFRTDLLNQSEYNLTTHQFAPGIYFLSVYTDGKMVGESKLIISN
ncbi:MAG: T9SS type A sorting domain-containing protein [Bacteroidia bacterium]|nr:T9SS type A sorting domain-containing protein [Bacteroidia bacterium]